MNENKSTEKHRYQQVYDHIRAAIDSGELKPGDRLPTVVDLAGQHGVTAATIRRALEDLIREGLVSSHVGRGTFVSRQEKNQQPQPGVAGTAAGTAGTAGTGTGMGTELHPASATARRPRKPVRNELARTLSGIMSTSQKPGTIAFTRGIGDPGMIEKGVLTRLTLSALAKGEELFHDYGDPRGIPALRESIAALYTREGYAVTPDQILVCSGSQQALYLLARDARESDTEVICEIPCYAGVSNAFEDFGLEVRTVQRGIDGPDPAEIAALAGSQPSLLYLCPFLHNPMGTNLSAERQKAIQEQNRKTGSLIVADEIFRDLHADGPLPPSFLAAPDWADSTVVLGSLSKSFISGLRVGWIVGSKERIQSLATTKKTMDLGCPPLMQGIAAAFLDDPEGYRAHRSRVARHYLARRDVTLAALEEYMPQGLTWTRPQGGFQLWVSLPEGMSSVELYLRCLERGAAFLPGPLQDPAGGFGNSFRLCYGSLEAPEIREGIRRIAETVRVLASTTGSTPKTEGFGDF